MRRSFWQCSLRSKVAKFWSLLAPQTCLWRGTLPCPLLLHCSILMATSTLRYSMVSFSCIASLSLYPSFTMHNSMLCFIGNPFVTAAGHREVWQVVWFVTPFAKSRSWNPHARWTTQKRVMEFVACALVQAVPLAAECRDTSEQPNSVRRVQTHRKHARHQIFSMARHCLSVPPKSTRYFDSSYFLIHVPLSHGFSFYLQWWKFHKDIVFTFQFLNGNLLAASAERDTGRKLTMKCTTISISDVFVTDQSLPVDCARELLGVTFSEAPEKHYFVLRQEHMVVEADATMQAIMEKLQVYRNRLTILFEVKLFPLHSDSCKLENHESVPEIPGSGSYGLGQNLFFCCPWMQLWGVGGRASNTRWVTST